MRAAVIAGIALTMGACTTVPDDAPAYAWDLPRGFQPPPVPADNPMTDEKVALGARLFFDTQLSGNGTQACASCHDPARAFTDGRVTPLGSTGAPGRHNAMSLVNVAYASALTWFDPTVATLEQQALVPMFGTQPVELGLTEPVLLARMTAYADAFDAAFPGEPITTQNVVKAIASYERTLIVARSRFDRGELTPAERHGQALFESDALGCRHCHDGFTFTVATGDRVQMFDTGLYDPYPASDRGLAEITGDAADAGRFKPPTLRDVALTAPYMHDGSIATLDEVVDAYARGGRTQDARRSPFLTGFTLSASDKADLIAFLGALTDEPAP